MADHLRLEQPDHRFGQRIIVRVADGAHRRLHAGLGQPLRVPDRQILAPTVAVVHQAIGVGARPDRLLECIEGQIGPQRARYAPADDHPGEDVNHERHVDEPPPRGYVRQIRHPQCVGPARVEIAIHQIRRPRRGLVRDRRLERAAPHRAAQTQITHQALHRAPRHRHPVPLQLPPDLPDTIDLEVLAPHALNARPQARIALRTRRLPLGICPPGCRGIVRRRGDRQHRADRLDPVRRSLRIDERRHHRGRRSSSACAKNAEAFRRISFARSEERRVGKEC